MRITENRLRQVAEVANGRPFKVVASEITGVCCPFSDREVYDLVAAAAWLGLVKPQVQVVDDDFAVCLAPDFMNHKDLLSSRPYSPKAMFQTAAALEDYPSDAARNSLTEAILHACYQAPHGPAPAEGWTGSKQASSEGAVWVRQASSLVSQLRLLTCRPCVITERQMSDLVYDVNEVVYDLVGINPGWQLNDPSVCVV